MARPIWKGHLSFGLVNVPVVLHSAEQRADISFHLVDSRNSARVRYERVNEETGNEVPWDKIVKGFEYDDGNYVLLSEQEIERASPELTRIIEIEEFIDLSEIDVRCFERPYVLVPGQSGEKGYVLLREALATSGKAGIATVVIRSRQYLAALLPQGNALLLELLRYQQELRDLAEFDIPGQDLRKLKVNKKEIDLATQLIDGMTVEWDIKKHHDEYRDVLMKLIEKKIKSGQTEAIEVEEEEHEAGEPQTINFIDVLKQSVAKTARRGAKKRVPRKKATTTRTRRPKKKRAG